MKRVLVLLTLFLAIMTACSSQSFNGTALLCSGSDWFALEQQYEQGESDAKSGQNVTPPIIVVDPIRVVDLVVTDNVLVWSYTNLGDCNQDGRVSHEDLVPLAIHLGHPPATDPYDQVVDCNGDGVASVADAYYIGMYYRPVRAISGYYVEGRLGDKFHTVGTYQLSDGGNSKIQKLIFHHPIPTGSYVAFRVVPKFLKDGLGTPSNEVAP
jgi:hypothetical protein